MLYSRSTNSVFIEVPKTASSSLCQLLSKEYPEKIVRNFVNANGFGFVLKNHETVSGVVAAFLDRNLPLPSFLAVLRSPKELLMSKYSFYRNGRPARQLTDMGRLPFGLYLRVRMAQLLPYWLWIWLYPFRSSLSFLGKCRDVGDIQCTLFDFSRIDVLFPGSAVQLGIISSRMENIVVPFVNTSSHSSLTIAGRLSENLYLFAFFWAEVRLYAKLSNSSSGVLQVNYAFL